LNERIGKRFDSCGRRFNFRGGPFDSHGYHQRIAMISLRRRRRTPQIGDGARHERMEPSPADNRLKKAVVDQPTLIFSGNLF